MSDTVCPYCRGPVLAEDVPVVCNGCGAPHHSDCYEENGGCTVFGCACAPPEEPKVSVSTPDLVSATAATAVAAPPVVSRTAPPPPPGVNQARVTTLADLEHIANRVVPSMFGSFEEPVPEPAEEEIPTDPKSRVSYMVLGALLGAFGAHNFYAGYYKKAWLQLAITVLSVGFAGIMSWIWAVIDICTIDRDSHGVLFTS
jgi:TM2 domain-containing membrane protein YozV